MTVGGITYLGADDLMTPFYSNGQRRLISNNDTLILKDVYGYTMADSGTYGTEYDTLDSSGLLRITPPGSGNNTISITSNGSAIDVSMTLGSPVAGADPNTIFTEFNSSTSAGFVVSSISVYSLGGNDTVTVNTPGIQANVDVGQGNNTITLDSPAAAETVTAGDGSDTLTVNNLTGNINISLLGVTDGNGAETTMSGIDNLTLNGTVAAENFYQYGNPTENSQSETINGGDGNDTLTFGGPAGFDALPDPHFNGGPGNNSMIFDDTGVTTHHEFDMYQGELASSGSSNYGDFSNVQNVTINGGSGDDLFKDYLINTSFILVMFGNGGNDTFDDGDSVNYTPASTIPANVYFHGGNGFDQIVVDDVLHNASAKTYSLDYGSVRTSTSGICYYFTDDELISVEGTSNYADTFNISYGSDTTGVSLTGGMANDSFNLNSGEQFNITVVGGGGVDSMTLDDRTPQYSPFRMIDNGGEWDRDFGNATNYRRYSVFYSGIDSPTYYAAVAATWTVVEAVQALPAGYQTTLVLNSGNDNVYLYPHDSSGNLDVNGAIGIIGGAGSDTLYLDDSQWNKPMTYAFANPYGSGTQDVTGIGTGGLGTAQIEYWNVSGGQGNDNYEINQWTSGVGLTIMGEGGNDTVDFTPTTQNVASYITSMSGFYFDGGAGFNVLDFYNNQSTSAWNYNQTSGYLYAATASPAYSRQMLEYNVTLSNAYGGSGNDTFLAQSTATGEIVGFFGNGGTNTYTLDSPTNTPNSISNVVIYSGSSGTDTITATDASSFSIPVTETVASMTLSNGSTGTLNPSGSTTQNVLTVPAVSISADSRFDLTNGAMIVHNGNLSGLAGLVRSGLGTSSVWAGPGIDSSTAAYHSPLDMAVGTISNSAGGTTPRMTTFDKIPVSYSDVLIKFTYFGDANFDGKVDGSDYSLIDSGYITHAVGWYNGDFNYDGVINGSDYTLIDNAFNTQGAAVPTAQVAAASVRQKATIAPSAPVPTPQTYVDPSLWWNDQYRRRHRI